MTRRFIDPDATRKMMPRTGQRRWLWPFGLAIRPEWRRRHQNLRRLGYHLDVCKPKRPEVKDGD